MASHEILEPIPATVRHRHFPIGDIDDDRLELRTSAVLIKLQDADREQRATLCKQMARLADVERWGITPPELRSLCQAWAKTLLPDDPEGYKLGWTTFHIAGEFARTMLPSVSWKFGEELRVMEGYNAAILDWVSSNGWTTMHVSHPSVYALMAPLCRLVVDVYHVVSDAEKLLVEAAMVLPYSLAAASRLIGYSRLVTPDRA